MFRSLVFALLLAVLVAAYWLGSNQAQTKAELGAATSELEGARSYIETRKETDDAATDLPDDPDAVRAGLRDLSR